MVSDVEIVLPWPSDHLASAICQAENLVHCMQWTGIGRNAWMEEHSASHGSASLKFQGLVREQKAMRSL